MTIFSYFLVVGFLLGGLLLALSVLLLSNFWQKNINVQERRGVFVYKLDPMTRKVTPYRADYSGSDNFQTHEFSVDDQIKENKLRRHLSRQFVVQIITQHPENSKLYREALQKIDNGQTEISYAFKYSSTRHFGQRVPLLFNVKLSKLDKVSDYLIVVNWKIDFGVQTDLSNHLTTPEDVANRPAKFKGFLAFNLNTHVPNVREIFICEILKLPIRFKYDIYEWRDLVLITCYAPTYKKVKRKVNYLVGLFKAKVDQAGWGVFIRGSGNARFQEVNYRKVFNRALSTLDFIVNLSIRWKQNFLDIKQVQEYQGEFTHYSEQIRIFRDAVRSHKFEIKLVPVKRIKDDKTVVNYSFATLPNVDKQQLSNILVNTYNLNSLIDAHAEKITSKKLTSQILLDVNSQWIASNLAHLEPTGVAYVIRFDNYDQLNQIAPTCKVLLEKGFVIGFRFRRFSQFTVTVLQQIKPSFIVFNYNLIVQDSQLQIENYLYLVSLRKIFETYKITIIWENFTEKNDRNLPISTEKDLYFLN